MKMRPRSFGMVEHDVGGLFPIRICTIHTRRGHGSWCMNLRKARALRNQLDKAIKRAEASKANGEKES